MNAQAAWGAPAGAVGLAAGWVLLAAADGGVDVGERASRGATALAVALVVAAPAAALVFWMSRERAVWRSGPTLLALGGLAGLAGLAAASLTWAPQPHIAWIETNQTLLYLAVAVIAAGLTARLRPRPEAIASLIAAAAALPVAAALAIEILPGLLGSDLDPGRLTRPAGYHNALALIAVAGIIGAVGAAPRRRGTRVLAAAASALFLTALALTLSRGGVLALLAGLAVLLALRGRRGVAVAPLLAGAAGAAPPIAWGLSHDVLTDERVPAVAREDAALALGLWLLAGLAVAAALTFMSDGRGSQRVGLAVVLVLTLGAIGTSPVAGAGAAPAAPGRSAVDNSPPRVLSLASNNRDAWWGEAWRGFRDAPIVGNGAGSFRMVHLRERRDDSSLFIARQPHQVVLKMLSDLGVAGLVLFLLWPVGLLWALTRTERGGPAGPAAAVLAAFFVQIQFDWLFSLPATAALAAACAGVLLAAAARGRSRPLPAEAAAAGGIVAVAGLVVLSAALPWLALREVDAAGRAVAAGDTVGALRHADRAAELNPLSPRPLEEEAFAHFSAGDIAAAAAARRRLTELQPENPFAWWGLATLLEGEAARTAWERVRELDPNNPAARRALGG